ncbi:DUF58 domain-containing protein [Fervidobacterium sp.]
MKVEDDMKNTTRIWTKLNSLLYLMVFGIITLNVFVYNKYVWIMDILAGIFLLHFFWLLNAAKNIHVTVTGKTRVFTDEKFYIIFDILSQTTKPLKVELIPPLTVKKPPTQIVINPNENVKLYYDTFFGTRGTKKLGYYTLKLESFTGLFSIMVTGEVPFDVKVFPSLEQADVTVERILEMLPVVKSKYKLVEDISYIRNIREYEREPLNRIHWKQSAKMGTLMVKEYEYAGTTKNYILLDLNLPAKIYSKAAWEFIHKKYQEESIRAVVGMLKFLSEWHEKTSLLVSHSQGTYNLSFNDYVLYFDYLAEVEGTLESEKDTSELLEHIIDTVQPTDTVLIVSMFLTLDEVERLLRLRTRCGRVVVLLMPYGYREATSKKFKSYFDVPVEVRELYNYARVLEEENILIEIWHENTSFMEGLMKIAEVQYM